MTNKLIPIKCLLANTFWQKLTGLMFKKSSPPLYLNHCTSIHTFFMQKNIHLLWLNKENIIIKIQPNIKPKQICFCPKASGVIEIFTDSINAETFNTYRIGQKIDIIK